MKEKSYKLVLVEENKKELLVEGLFIAGIYLLSPVLIMGSFALMEAGGKLIEKAKDKIQEKKIRSVLKKKTEEEILTGEIL